MAEGCSGSCGSCSSCGSCGGEDKMAKKMGLISRKILVLSGKGGVGKSSVAATLALQLAASGRKVGLLDCDFHGPSLPTILGVTHKKLDYSEENGIMPLPMGNLRFLSVGLLMDDPDQAIVWRGPAKMGVIKQLLEDTCWGELDDLVLDFPPGTGDEILSACQLIPGEKNAIVVTTPQEVSLADCRKCLDFCTKLELKVAGIVENMSSFVCPDCGKAHPLFSTGGGKSLAESYSLPLIAQLPLNPEFMAACDSGTLPEKIGQFPSLLNF